MGIKETDMKKLTSLHSKKIKILFKYLTRLMSGDVEKAIRVLTLADINHLLMYGRFIIPGNYVIDSNNNFHKELVITMQEHFIEEYVSESDFDRLSKSDLDHIDKALTLNYNELIDKVSKTINVKGEYNELDIINALLEGEERVGMYQYVKEHLDIQKMLNNI